MLGRLSVIGIGPGDPELLTLKAVKIIKGSNVLCVPKGRAEGVSLALSIVEQAVDLDGKEIIEAHFPMKKTMKEKGSGSGEAPSSLLDEQWNKTVTTIADKVKKGIDVAFLTLGDPTIYSTFFYLYDKLLDAVPGLNI